MAKTNQVLISRIQIILGTSWSVLVKDEDDDAGALLLLTIYQKLKESHGWDDLKKHLVAEWFAADLVRRGVRVLDAEQCARFVDLFFELTNARCEGRWIRECIAALDAYFE